MPKEHKKRGRREEKKRMRLMHDEQGEDQDDAQDVASKRQKYEEEEEDKMKGNLDSDQTPKEPAFDIPFFGLLDEDEQAYFKVVDSMLELNQFENDEERDLLLASVYKEAEGKELKIANSQSCSRLMERMIMMSNPSQLKALFQKFNGHFLHLVQHRFASHCCESLFLHSAPIVTQELIAPFETNKQDDNDDGIYISMENLFLYVVNELEGNLGYLMTDHFASHALRVLLVVLSGRPLVDTATTSLLQSKKKERIDIANQVPRKQDAYNVTRSVPSSFSEALDNMISGTMTGLDTTYLRALATHPVGNPVLQLLLELEFSRSGKQKAKDENSLFRRLLPDDPIVQGTMSASFITSLLYDAVGSRLLETVVQYAPGKVFKAMYRNLFREKLGNLAKNEIAGFVMIRMLERLSQEDLQHATEQICPQICNLVEHSRTSIIKTLIERCQVRGVDTSPISQDIQRAYHGENSNLLVSMLKLDLQDTEGMALERKKQLEISDAGKTHASFLAQSMLEAPGPLREMITASILSLDTSSLVVMARNRTATHVLQKALTCHGQTKLFLRKSIQSFQGHTLDLATDPIASHVVDIFWDAAGDQLFLRERVAQELLENEVDIKESFSGRVVWRNWMMDLYKRRRLDWIKQAKGIATDNEEAHIKDQQPAKSAIELAREKYAVAKKTQRNGKFQGKARIQVPKDQP